MDSAFLLNEEGRANFLRFVMQSSGCTYICLWSYLPFPSNCLLFMDGIYHEGNKQSPSSSMASLARRLFDEYRNSVFMVETDSVPGLAFKNNLPYFELKDLDLRRLASIELQSRFYQEAGIKTAIFMGCNNGEIELGFSNVQQTQMNMEMEMRNWFPENFLQKELPQTTTTTDQNRVLSSSSSSLRSISLDSPDNPSIMFNIPTPSSYMPAEPFKETPLILEQALRPIYTLPNPTSTSPHQLLQPAMQAFARTPVPFPTLESDDAAMTRAMLAVISSPSSSSSSHLTHHNSPYHGIQEASAFKSYNSALAPLPVTQMKSNNLRGQSMLNRAFTYLRSLNLRRIHENNMQQGNRPTSTQLHHMISERKRREKLNESFQALRSLLPPGSKRDKASVLANTREYLTTLKAEVSELTRKNQLLEARLIMPIYNKAINEEDKEEEEEEGSSNERISVRVTPVSDSTSRDRMVNLRVTARGGGCSKLDMVIRLLEFLKQVENVSLESMAAETRMAESSSNSTDRVVLRLKIEGTEWDESTFQETIKSVLADLAR